MTPNPLCCVCVCVCMCVCARARARVCVYSGQGLGQWVRLHQTIEGPPPLLNGSKPFALCFCVLK